MDNTGNSGYNESVYDTYNDKPEINQYTPSSGAENTLLSNVYTNEEEGFSFMYPEDWKVGNNPDALGYVGYRDALGNWANVAVMKEVDDGSYFAATESDFEEAYSSEAGLSDVKVMDLSDMVLDGCTARKMSFVANNDNGIRVIGILYFYNRDIYVYSVMCAVEEVNYGRYEPIFNAIMDSYTITAANDEYDVGMQTQNDENDYLFDKWILAGEYEGEDVMPPSNMSINIYSSPEDDMVGNYNITIPRSGIEYTGELCRESDRTFVLVSKGEICATIEVVGETFGAVVIYYSENGFECNYRMDEAYPMP